MGLSVYKERVILISVLMVILVYSFTGELIPANNGAGFDGYSYYLIAQDFDTLIVSHGINQYYMTRFLPWAVIHYLLVFLNVPITISSAVLCAKFLNFSLILLLLVYFYKLSKLLNWDMKSEILAFSFVFFNFPVLKYFGYYPMMCDCAAYILSYIGIFYFLSNRTKCLIVVIILSIMTWPILSAMLLVLLLLPRGEIKLECSDKFSRGMAMSFRYLFVSFPFLYLLYILIRCDFDFMKALTSYTTLRGVNRYDILIPALLMTSLFYYNATKVLKVNWKRLFTTFSARNMSLIVLGGAIFVLAYTMLNQLGGEHWFDYKNELRIILHYYPSDILFFLETPFLYLGLFFLFVLFFWRDINKFVCRNFGIGYFLLMLFSLIMILDVETRKLTSFYPLMLVPLICCLNGENIRKYIVFAVPIICLITSFFWFEINTPEIGNSFLKPVATFAEFPAQRYFMFHGPWQSHSVYWVVITIEAFMFFSFRYLYKKGYVIDNKSEKKDE